MSDTDRSPPPSSPRPALCEIPFDKHAQDAGIVNLMHGGVKGSVSVLTCKTGTVRANHWHRLDSHWLYVLSGVVEYYERGIGSLEKPDPQIFHTGEMFYTPPRREHAMYFPIHTVLISMSDRTRTHEEHERDVVRLSSPIVVAD